MTDFYNNLISLTNNLEDIAFTKYATITNINSDGTCTAKEDEEEGLTHENINTLGNNLRVGDKVVLGFVDNSIYNPVILTGGEEAYTKTETDALLQKNVTDLIDMIYPVGSIYMSVNSVNPSTLFGGTWEQIEDTSLLASGTIVNVWKRTA